MPTCDLCHKSYVDLRILQEGGRPNICARCWGFKERMNAKRKKEKAEDDEHAERLRQNYLIRTGRTEMKP